jgi:hypothetical protein
LPAKGHLMSWSYGTRYFSVVRTRSGSSTA